MKTASPEQFALAPKLFPWYGAWPRIVNVARSWLCRVTFGPFGVGNGGGLSCTVANVRDCTGRMILIGAREADRIIPLLSEAACFGNGCFEKLLQIARADDIFAVYCLLMWGKDLGWLSMMSLSCQSQMPCDFQSASIVSVSAGY